MGYITDLLSFVKKQDEEKEAPEQSEEDKKHLYAAMHDYIDRKVQYYDEKDVEYDESYIPYEGELDDVGESFDEWWERNKKEWHRSDKVSKEEFKHYQHLQDVEEHKEKSDAGVTNDEVQDTSSTISKLLRKTKFPFFQLKYENYERKIEVGDNEVDYKNNPFPKLTPEQIKHLYHGLSHEEIYGGIKDGNGLTDHTHVDFDHSTISGGLIAMGDYGRHNGHHDPTLHHENFLPYPHDAASDGTIKGGFQGMHTPGENAAKDYGQNPIPALVERGIHVYVSTEKNPTGVTPIKSRRGAMWWIRTPENPGNITAERAVSMGLYKDVEEAQENPQIMSHGNAVRTKDIAQRTGERLGQVVDEKQVQIELDEEEEALASNMQKLGEDEKVKGFTLQDFTYNTIEGVPYEAQFFVIEDWQGDVTKKEGFKPLRPVRVGLGRPNELEQYKIPPHASNVKISLDPASPIQATYTLGDNPDEQLILSENAAEHKTYLKWRMNAIARKPVKNVMDSLAEAALTNINSLSTAEQIMLVTKDLAIRHGRNASNDDKLYSYKLGMGKYRKKDGTLIHDTTDEQTPFFKVNPEVNPDNDLDKEQSTWWGNEQTLQEGNENIGYKKSWQAITDDEGNTTYEIIPAEAGHETGVGVTGLKVKHIEPKIGAGGKWEGAVLRYNAKGHGLVTKTVTEPVTLAVLQKGYDDAMNNRVAHWVAPGTRDRQPAYDYEGKRVARLPYPKDDWPTYGSPEYPLSDDPDEEKTTKGRVAKARSALYAQGYGNQGYHLSQDHIQVGDRNIFGYTTQTLNNNHFQTLIGAELHPKIKDRVRNGDIGVSMKTIRGEKGNAVAVEGLQTYQKQVQKYFDAMSQAGVEHPPYTSKSKQWNTLSPEEQITETENKKKLDAILKKPEYQPIKRVDSFGNPVLDPDTGDQMEDAVYMEPFNTLRELQNHITDGVGMSLDHYRTGFARDDDEDSPNYGEVLRDNQGKPIRVKESTGATAEQNYIDMRMTFHGYKTGKGSRFIKSGAGYEYRDGTFGRKTKRAIQNAWITNPRGSTDSYHNKKKLKKEGAGLGDGGGTAFTSADAGVFTPTFSERGTRKKNDEKKRTGVDRLADFVNENSPERKMVKYTQTFSLDLVNWVTKELRKTEQSQMSGQGAIPQKGNFRQQKSGETINSQPPRLVNGKNFYQKDEELPEDKDAVVEFDSEPDDTAAVEQNRETDRIKELYDEEENAKPKDTEGTDMASPEGITGVSPNIRLDVANNLYESGGTESDELHQGGKKDLERGVVDDPSDEHEDEEFVKSFIEELELVKEYYDSQNQ